MFERLAVAIHGVVGFGRVAGSILVLKVDRALNAAVAD